MKPRHLPRLAATLLLTGFCATASAANSAAAKHFKNPQTSGLKLSSIGALNFGPDGLLLIAEPRAAAIIAVDTGDTGPLRKLAKPLEKVDELLGARLGVPAKNVKIIDMAVNPASGRIYFALLRQPGNTPVILTVGPDGAIDPLKLDELSHVQVPFPQKDGVKIGNISDVAFAKDRILAAGQSNEEFSSKIFVFPLPLTHQQSGQVFSAETYHVSHRKWETRAPIRSFIPLEDGGKHYVVGAFACTPIAKFPLDDIQSGANIQGTSVVELGSGNRPLDMFTYESGGKKWVVTNTQRFHANLFGPSKYWGLRLTVDFLTENDASKINEKAARRNVKEKSGPAGMEIVDGLFGAVEVDKLSDRDMVVLRENGEHFNLEVAPLP